MCHHSLRRLAEGNMNALVCDAVVHNGQIRITDLLYKAHAARMAKHWGEGAALRIRIEPEEEAKSYGQIKHYWGHVVTPFCEWTGYYKHEVHAMLKAECMPEGKTSLTELSREEMAAFSEAAEQTAREWAPEAFTLYDYGVA